MDEHMEISPAVRRLLLGVLTNGANEFRGMQLRPQQKQEPLKKSAALTKTVQERAAREGSDVLPHRLLTKRCLARSKCPVQKRRQKSRPKDPYSADCARKFSKQGRACEDIC
ncbi:hypothetical protein MTO96_010206 [Rhipicephalus appendiculatus]